MKIKNKQLMKQCIKHIAIILYLTLSNKILAQTPEIKNTKTQHTDIKFKTDTVVKKYPSGAIKVKGKLINGIKQGNWYYYHENGQKAMNKKFIDGIEQGDWIYYNEEGKICLKIVNPNSVNTIFEISMDKKGKIIAIKSKKDSLK